MGMPELKSLSKYEGINLKAKLIVRHALVHRANLRFALALPLARLVALPLLQRKFVLGRVPIFFGEKPGGDIFPELATFLGQLLLERTHHLGDDL